MYVRMSIVVHDLFAAAAAVASGVPVVARSLTACMGYLNERKRRREKSTIGRYSILNHTITLNQYMIPIVRRTVARYYKSPLIKL